MKQPYEDASGNILCWNGEAWDGLDMGMYENDTLALAQALDATELVQDVMKRIRGPYAFVYYQVEYYNALEWFLSHRQDCISYGMDVTGLDVALSSRAQMEVISSCVALVSRIETDGRKCLRMVSR